MSVPSKRAYLEFVNLTTHSIEVKSEWDDEFDWDNDNRPSKIFPGDVLAPFTSIKRRLELADRAGASNIHMRLTYTDGPNAGSSKRIDCDMEDARAGGDWNCREFVAADVKGNPNFYTYQVAGGDTNRFALVRHGANNGNLGDWMSELPGEMPLFDLFVPGTHDSACSGRPGADTAGWASTWTQSSGSIRYQLDLGIRAFDLRFEYVNNPIKGEDVLSVHTLDMHYSGKEIVRELGDWVSTHPHEIVFAKMRGNADCAPLLKQAIRGEPGQLDFTRYFWSAGNWPSTVSEARGRILVLTENSLGEPSALGGIRKVISWTDNCTFESCSIGGRDIFVQDNYDGPTMDDKWANIKSTFYKSMSFSGFRGDWFFNFASASSAGFYPKAYACGTDGKHWGMNRRLFYMLTTYTRQGIDGAIWANGSKPPKGIMWLDYFQDPMNMNAIPRIMAAINYAPR